MTPEFPEFTELAFDSERHIYRLAGKYIPAVSTIIRPLSTAFYKDVDEDVLKAAAGRGTSIHQSIENFIKFDIKDASEEIQPYLDAFVKWWQSRNPTPIKSEYRVYHPLYRYAGTSDLICEIDGKVVCVDYKSSVEVSKMLTRIQLEAYVRAIRAHNMPLEGKAILHLRRDGTFDFIDDYKPTDTEAWEVFGALLTTYNYLQKYQGGT